MAAVCGAQAAGPAQAPAPLYRETLVERIAQAVDYRSASGTTRLDFRGTAQMPHAGGSAEVGIREGRNEIKARLGGLEAPSSFGPEYLTYVLWAVTPEDGAQNLGEVTLDRRDARRGALNVATGLRVFGLIVTAEPYYAVSQPSDVVVLESAIRAGAAGGIEEVDARYELLKRGQYALNAAPPELAPLARGPGEPLALAEARNAVRIARWTGAARYAASVLAAAELALRNAEIYQHSRAEGDHVIRNAREAVERSRDAREIAIRRMGQERLASERADAAEREQRARDAAGQVALERAQAEERHQAEAARAAAAERDRIAAAERAQAEERHQAEAARAAAAERDRIAAAERAQAEAAAEADRPRQAAEQARAAQLSAELDRARQAAAEKQQSRTQLRHRLSAILETRETPRGLIVILSDTHFYSATFRLKPATREKLAQVSAVLLAHPGLRIQVEGHTDSAGGDRFNQRLSERRAGAVRAYLVAQGIPRASITAHGFGRTRPVAFHHTAAGRYQNQRVEMVVSSDGAGPGS